VAAYERHEKQINSRYFGVDLSIIWNILTNEIPVLHEQIKKIIKDLS